MAYIYIIGEEVGDTISAALKIGIADNPSSRRRQMQTGNPRPLLELHNQGFPSHREAQAVETKVHRALAHCRLTGEWFAISVERAVAAIQESAAQ